MALVLTKERLNEFIKTGEVIYGNKTLSAEQMELEIFEYIEICYNKARRHSVLQNMTIDEFWKHNKISA